MVTILKNDISGPGLVSLVLTALLLAAPLPTAADAPGSSDGEVSQEAGSVEGSVAKSEQIHHETLNESEEFLLSKTLKQLKANNLNDAVANLAKLKDAFPDNDDYLLLYRTALRRRNSSDADSQKWWAYERSLNKKEDEKTALLTEAQTSLSAPRHGRINQLKHATWLQLTTGKHKSPNGGRRAQPQVNQDQER